MKWKTKVTLIQKNQKSQRFGNECDGMKKWVIPSQFKKLREELIKGCGINV